MRIFYSLILLFALFIGTANCQDEMIVNTKCLHCSRGLNEFLRKVDSIAELPQSVQSKLKSYLSKFMGSMVDSTSYAEGEVLDLESYCKKVPYARTNSKNGLITKYYLQFLLKDKSIGIENYCLHVELGEEGQLISIDWPQSGYNDKSKFISRNDIKEFALKYTDSVGFKDQKWKIRFRQSDKNLSWDFEYFVESGENYRRFKVFSIPWISLQNIEILKYTEYIHADTFQP